MKGTTPFLSVVDVERMRSGRLLGLDVCGSFGCMTGTTSSS